MKLPPEVYLMDRYCKHAFSAERRGLGFSFTFAQWCAWWEANLGPDWFSKRGPGQDQYCMARKGDKGSYEPNNVECVTNWKNAKDRRRNGVIPYGERVNTCKLTEAKVKDIFLSTETTGLIAKKHGVTVHAIRAIRSGECWMHVTRHLGLPKYRWYQHQYQTRLNDLEGI